MKTMIVSFELMLSRIFLFTYECMYVCLFVDLLERRSHCSHSRCCMWPLWRGGCTLWPRSRYQCSGPTREYLLTWCMYVCIYIYIHFYITYDCYVLVSILPMRIFVSKSIHCNYFISCVCVRCFSCWLNATFKGRYCVACSYWRTPCRGGQDSA